MRVNRPTASQIHGYAAFRLGLMGSAASNAVPTLLELLKFRSKYSFDGDRARIIQALGFIGPSASQSAPSLVQELQNPTDWIKRTTARSFLQMGTVPPEAISFLKENLSVEFLEKEDPSIVRQTAVITGDFDVLRQARRIQVKGNPSAPFPLS